MAKSKKSKIFRGLGIGLIAAALLFFVQIGSLQKEYEEVAKTNEARAQLRLEKANFYKTTGIILVVGGIVCLVFGFNKSKKED